jgi:hypothetical protein
MTKLEKDVEGPAGKYAKSLGIWHAKFKSANNRGVPDRIFIAPSETPGRTEGYTFFIEFKKPGKKKADPLQKIVIDEMREHGALIYVTDDLEVAKAIIFDFYMSGQCSLQNGGRG